VDEEEEEGELAFFHEFLYSLMYKTKTKKPKTKDQKPKKKHGLLWSV